jgi:hypothetical protein
MLVLLIILFLSCILSSPTPVTAPMDTTLLTERIVNKTIIQVAQQNHIPLNDSQFLFISQEFRKVALEVLPSYQVKIMEHPSQVNLLIVEAGQKMTQKLESSSLQKRYIFGAMSQIVKQIMLLLIVTVLINTFITGPKLKIRKWYCKNHPCEPDDD